MSMPGEDVTEATRYQRMAAEPRKTCLASANAGSGKTKVLVDRVSRLLLDGANPDKILCLTYTKAAASEMQTRLFEKLGGWSVMHEDKLNSALDELLGETKARNADELGAARQLFARALETPDGLKVQTIHAFCETVLSRFPIEAGILPGFEPMEDADVAALRGQIEEDIYAAAWADQEGSLAGAIKHLAADKADKTLEGIFKWAAGNREAVNHWAKSVGIDNLALRLQLSPDATVAEQYDAAWGVEGKQAIKSAANDLLGSSNANDVKKANAMLAALTEPDPVAAFKAYEGIILTQKGTLRKSVITLSAPPAAQDFFGTSKMDPTDEALRVLACVQKIVSATCLEMTRSVFIIARDYAARYETAKRARRWLDFDDQINLVRKLLINSEAAEWVRYKLDGGIGHILVDEAQDTAPDQWTIIEALKDGFALPDPEWPMDRPKTFFAVGDEKQSIYSFQGARPEQFIKRIRDYVGENIDEAVTMAMSFRSSPDVLRVVDAVFVDQKGIQRMFNLDPLSEGSFEAGHTAFRRDGGLVELWPLAPRPEETPEEIPWDFAPVDSLDQSSPREKLARTIAETIAGWLKSGEPIFDRKLGRTRRMRAEDILILVRRRNDFFDAVIRNMKTLGIPVAGADRLVLKDSMAVKDMLALSRFTLLPSDDLSLAEALKSPLFGFTEDELFQTAKRRGKLSLWQSLRAQTFDKARAAVADLEKILKFSHTYAPYEFYARVFDMQSPTGGSLLKNIYARLGVEAKDVLEAFLARALAHQRRGAPSLQHFVQSFIGDDQDIKREMDAASGEVRVMTVHGAKGLEAPVVFLPDTTQTPSGRSGSGLVPVGEGFAYLPSADTTPDILQPLKDAIKLRELEEYMRLLYVAMTRAESRLIVCGFESGHRNGKGYTDGCWHAEVRAALEGLEAESFDMTFGEGLRYGNAALTPKGADGVAAQDTVTLPSWAHIKAEKEQAGPAHVTPSHLLAPAPQKDMPVRSPLLFGTAAGPDRFLRGNIIHRLLEILPELPLDSRAAAATALLDSYQDLAEAQRAQIKDEVFKVLDAPEFAPFFALGSRAEVSLAGRGGALPEGLYFNAQIDRLAVTDDKVYIVDYKSNRPPPTDQADVPEIYWGQMAAYRELAKDIYPGREIICALLWTDGPFLMTLDTKRLDAALTLIGSLPT